jgi:hypothetical protein
MGQWFQTNHRLFQKEREELASSCRLLRLAVVGPGFQINKVCRLKVECAVVHGTYDLQIPDSGRAIEYGIVLVLPGNYPKAIPDLLCNDPKLPIGNLDRHIMSNGMACLGVQAEIRMHWPPGSTVANFLDRLVAPFLAWQVYYDAYHNPPPWGGRSHFEKGILEFYAELFKVPADLAVIDFMQILARKNRPKGHEPCPCNSGKPLRKCHRDELYQIRERISCQDVEKDLAALSEVTKGSK